MAYGSCSTAYGSCPIAYGLRLVSYGLRLVSYGYGLRLVSYGLRLVSYSVWWYGGMGVEMGRSTQTAQNGRRVPSMVCGSIVGNGVCGDLRRAAAVR